MKLGAGERLAVWVGTACALASLAAAVLAWVAPTKVFYLIDLDRQIRPVPPHYQLAAGTAFSALAATCILVTLAIALDWRGARRWFARAYAAPADEFLNLIAADLSAWRRDPAFRTHAVTLLLLVGMGVWFRLTPLGFPVSYDESISLVWFSSRSWLDVLSDYTIPNNHILYNLLVNAILTTGHPSPLAVRLPALIAGVLLIPAVYWLVRRLLNANAALLTAGLTAAAPVIVEYSTQGRGYTLLWLLFLTAFVLATYLRDRGNAFGWTLVAVTTAAGLWTVPVMIYGVATIGMWMLVSSDRRRRLALLRELTVTGVATVMLTLVAYLPVLLRTRDFALTPGRRSNLLDYPSLLQAWTADLPVITLAAFAICLAVYVLPRPRLERRAWLVLIAGFIAHLVFAVAGTFPPNRVLYYLFFLVAGVAAYALDRFWQSIAHRAWGASLWAPLVLVIAASWGWTRLGTTRVVAAANGTTWVGTRAPGADGTTCCADGYFVDARPVIADFGPQLLAGDAIVAKDLMGSVETLRFYLIEAGLSPVLVHPYRRQYGLEQLEPYGQIYVLVKEQAGRLSKPAAAGPTAAVAETLDVSVAEFGATFRTPIALASYRTSTIYRVDRIVPDERSRAERGPVPFNMFWYW